MKALVLALCAACVPVGAETPDVADSITFTRAELDQLQKDLDKLIANKQREAYQAGQQAQKAACRSLI